MKGQVYMTCIRSCLLYGWDVGHENRAVGWRARFTWDALEELCLLYGWDVGHENRAGGWRARFTWHALEAVCCMGEMWAMRAELEDEGPGLHGMHYKVLVVWVRCGPWEQSWRMKGQVYMTCIRSCLLYGWDVGHEGRAGGWRARFTWHALEAACCMGEMWAMRAEL